MAEAVESMQAWSELLRLGSDGGEYDDELAAELVAELNRRGEPVSTH